jgi:intracellular septation protein
MLGVDMKFLIDLLPVVVLFVVFKFTGDMLAATKAAMVASVVQIALLKLKKLPIKAIHWFGLAAILVLGGLSVYLKDEFYLQLKFTIVEWVLAAAILIGQYVFKKNMLQTLLGSELELPDVAWDKLALSYAVFFIIMGGLNLLVMLYFKEHWVDFKFYGSFVLMFVFVIWQSTWLGKYMVESEPKP